MKLRKNIIYIVLIIILCFFTMCSCNYDDDFRNPINGEPEAGEFYTLQEAFDNGWLSRGDLRNIAYHRTGDGQKKGFKPTPKNPAVLSAETELAIKEAYAANLRERGILEAVADGVGVNNYFGIYNDLVTVFIYDKYSGYADVILNQTIGGIKFTYNNSNEIMVWKQI